MSAEDEVPSDAMIKSSGFVVFVDTATKDSQAIGTSLLSSEDLELVPKLNFSL